jgi:hypothetical protein
VDLKLSTLDAVLQIGSCSHQTEVDLKQIITNKGEPSKQAFPFFSFPVLVANFVIDCHPFSLLLSIG